MNSHSDPFLEGLPRLLVRVPAAHGEGVLEYLLRLAHVNGLPSARFLVPPGTRSVGFRLCPECLREFGRWSHCWHKAEFPVCRVHGCWLVDQCADCGSKFLWPRLGFRRCHCGADLMSLQTQRISTSVRSHITAEHPTEIEVLLWLGAWSLFGPKGKPLKKASGETLDSRKAILTRGIDMVLGWPHTFFAALSCHRMPSPSGQLQKLTEAWPGLPVQIRRLSNVSWRERIWESINAFVGETLDSHSPIIGRNPHLVCRPQTQKRVANRLQIGVCRLTKFSTSQASITPFRESRSGRRRIVISQLSESLLKDQISEWISVRECAKLVGCSRRRISALIASGSLVSKSNRINRTAAHQLRNSLLQVNDFPLEFPDALSLAHCFQFRVPVHLADSFLNTLLRRKIRSSCISGALDWSGVHVHRNDLDSWLNEAQSIPTNYLSVRESAAVLRIKEQVAYGLVKRGLIPSIFVPGAGKRIQRKSLMDFEARYVALSDLAEHPRALGNRAYEWALAQGLDLVTGPKIDGGRQYFVEKHPVL